MALARTKSPRNQLRAPPPLSAKKGPIWREAYCGRNLAHFSLSLVLLLIYILFDAINTLYSILVHREIYAVYGESILTVEM